MQLLVILATLLTGVQAPADVHVHQVTMEDGRANVLTWESPPDTAVSGFRILRQPVRAKRWDTLGTAARWHSRYVDDQLSNGARYRYRVVSLAGSQVAASEPTDYVPEARRVNINFNVLLVVAIAVLLGTVGARLFKRFKVPQVVAYILIGVGLGSSALGIIDQATMEGLTPLSLMALGLIGFKIGGELKLSVFRRHGKKVIIILLAEGIGAFAVVVVLVGLVTGNWALALVLGAIASATAPAATVNVIWEYRALGVLTTMILAVVALDDGLALMLFGFASSIAKVIAGGGGFSLLNAVGRPLLDILGTFALGVGIAIAFRYVYRHVREKELLMAFALGGVLLLVGGAQALRLDLILAAMVFGAVFTNLAGKGGEEVFDSVQRFAPPIYVLFFVLVGAHLRLGALNWMIALVAVLYVVGRTAGKVSGVWVAARATKAATAVRKYLGFGLLAQAGVAIGLAILSSHTFADYPEIATTVVAVVTTTTFLLEILGPPAVKFAITKAGETGVNITPEDLLETYKVKDVMNTQQPVLDLHAPLDRILDIVAQSEAVYFPVVDSAGVFRGVITLEGLKATINMPHMGPLILAQDIMEECRYTVTPESSLAEAQRIMVDRKHDYLPVVDGDRGKRFVGFLILRQCQRVLEEEIARRRRKAEAIT
ncbi:MAG: cation:proton antiporter [candidate division WOR-3 bacterium]|nr:MAG: cation:proton antiporter [candidate division WOR-3 bacterium]